MRILRISVVFISLWLGAAAPGHAQGDLGVEAQSLGTLPDLSELIRARPPMGDCPVGATDEHGILPKGSHLLHLGVPRFYRDYRRRLKLSADLVRRLSDDQERALKAWSAQQKAIGLLEVRVWEMTGAADLSFEKLEGVLGELAKARASQRLQYIRAVQSASELLTDAQRSALIGS